MKIDNVINQTPQINSQPNFGSTASLGKKILSNPTLKKIADKAEYDKFSMSLPSMMTVLYGATIVPRYCQARDKHDRREILTRDFLSITAILFGSKVLSRGFSKLFSKASGFALTNKPNIHQSLTEKLKNYIKVNGGVDVLNSQELTLKYSKLENYQNGISDFCKFVREQGGDIRKILSYKKGGVKNDVETIVGKDLKSATIEEVENGFEAARTSTDSKIKTALANVYKGFEDPKNAFVNKAKTMNSTFDFASTVLLVPGFMIWLEKFNEKMTKKAIAKDLAKAEAQKKTEQTEKPADKISNDVNVKEPTKKAFAAIENK